MANPLEESYRRGSGEASERPKMKFPEMMNHAEASIADGRIEFSYLNSASRAVTRRRPLLAAARIAEMVEERLEGFNDSVPGSRESDEQRAARKYVAAHPVSVLKEAWKLLDEHGQMEMCMMLSMASHHGISNPKWLETHALGTGGAAKERLPVAEMEEEEED